MSSPINPAARRALRQAKLARALSWLAAAIGLAAVVAFLAQAGLFAILLPREAPPQPRTSADQITATQSTVSGIDRQNQPYELTAKRGWQDEKVPSIVHLEGPEGRFRRGQGAEYTLSAETGLYDTRAKSLDLAGNVVLAQDQRFTARMEKANVVVEEKKLVSQGPVAVTFASGTVHANGMQITDDGARILFLNGVKARFDAPQAKGDANP
ncbi:LPS export ABC transporter periplasmic protein LptC [Aestuariivirga sp.]|uniref:LPS export ABC transporter periplasmic protein LptC n=1 Tax=Aestuariivirga sp. TaxID=2650926 RepID=UPI00391C5587